MRFYTLLSQLDSLALTRPHYFEPGPFGWNRMGNPLSSCSEWQKGYAL